MEASEEEWVNSQSTKARVLRYAISQLLQWFSELTHLSSEPSKSYLSIIKLVFKKSSYLINTS